MIKSLAATRPFQHVTSSLRLCLASHLPLFLFLLAIYLLTYTPHINSSDGLAMFSTAESIIRRDALDIEQIRWMDLQQGTYGLDGLLYSRKGIGLPLGLLPLTWLGLVVPWFGTVGVSLLFNAVVTALTAVLLLIYLQALGFSQRTGLIVALTFGLTTLAWPYAKSLFSDPLASLLLLSTALVLLKFRKAEGTGLGYAFLAGLFLSWNVATRYAEAIFLPVFGLLLLHYLGTKLEGPGTPLARLWQHRRSAELWLPILIFSVPILFVGLALIMFNVFRYGDPFNTGYLPNETFSGILWQGIVGQLISPGRGLLLYNPILILALLGLPLFFRRFRPEALLAVAIIVIHLLLYGKWFMWHGGFAWGSRFMVPTLPFWALFLAPVAGRAFPGAQTSEALQNAFLDSEAGSAKTASDTKIATDRRGLLLRIAFLTLAGLGLVVQLLTVTTDFAPFQNFLLETGLPLFAPQTFFDPQYSPLLHAWRFIRPEALDLAWIWRGRFNGWLLFVLGVNIILTGLNLRLSASIRVMPKICVLSTLGTMVFLLTQVHLLPAESLQGAMAALNEGVRPTDAVITNDPDMAIPFAELYKGRAPVLGLNSGGFPLPGDISQRLEATLAQHEQIWWLPNRIPPQASAVEQTLLATSFRARNDSYEDLRLVLFAHPTDLTSQAVPVDATFANLIALNQIAFPQHVTGPTALPVELQWQALAPMAEDYHVFVHLLAEDGQIVAQADGQPALWARPTSTWKPGEIVVDRHGLWLGPATPRGVHQLRVGLYRPEDGQRLSLPNDEDSIRFEVQVE